MFLCIQTQHEYTNTYIICICIGIIEIYVESRRKCKGIQYIRVPWKNETQTSISVLDISLNQTESRLFANIL